jgi:hypothetical protein
MRIALPLACLFAFYFPAAYLARIHFAPPPEPGMPGEMHELLRPYSRYLSSGAIALDYWFQKYRDPHGPNSLSPILLFENDRELGPIYSSPREEISTLGHGRFSHWDTVFIFSSSDGTDPLTNRRHYWAVYPTSAAGLRSR